MQEILQLNGVWDSTEESRFSITENISDIKSGKEYKKQEMSFNTYAPWPWRLT